MSMIDRILNRLGYTKAQAKVDGTWLSAYANVNKYNPPNMATAQNQADLFTRLSWVAIAVSHVAEQSALVPFNVKRKEGEETVDIPNHPFEVLLDKPNPMESRYEFLNSLAANYKLTGNGFIWLNRTSENQVPMEMWTVPSYQLTPIPDGKMFIAGYEYDPGDGNKKPIPHWQVVHLKRFNPMSRYWGLSQISQLAVVAVGDIEMQKHNTAYFQGDAGKLPGFLAFADKVSDPEWESIKFDVAHAAELRELMMLRNVGKGGVEWVQNGLTQAEMQFLEGRKFNKEEIFDWLAPGLSSWLSVNGNRANSEMGKAAFQELAVWPVLEAMAQKITNDVLPMFGDNLLGEFEDIRPSDRKLTLWEQEAYERTHTLNEIRAEYYGDDPVDGGDVIAYVASQVNSIDPLTQEGAGVDADTEAKAHERSQFRRFAAKRHAEGKPQLIDRFKFKYLDLDEQEALKAEYQDDTPDLLEGLRMSIDALREATDARS